MCMAHAQTLSSASPCMHSLDRSHSSGNMLAKAAAHPALTCLGCTSHSPWALGVHVEGHKAAGAHDSATAETDGAIIQKQESNHSELDKIVHSQFAAAFYADCMPALDKDTLLLLAACKADICILQFEMRCLKESRSKSMLSRLVLQSRTLYCTAHEAQSADQALESLRLAVHRRGDHSDTR